MKKITVITTEYNELDNIDSFLDSLLSQSKKPDEIVIADAGSTDGTVEKIKQRIKNGDPIKLVIAKGNRSVGRNTAILKAKNKIIAVTDAGCKLDKDWLKNITNPIIEEGADAVAGFYRTKSKNFFEETTNDFFYHSHNKIDLDSWLPSSRSIAFTKTVWEKAGGYPEYKEYGKSKIALKCGGEDTIFDLRIKSAGYRFASGLNAFVYWRPRDNLKGLFSQYVMYSLGDGLTQINASYFYSLTLSYIFMILFIILSFINILFIIPLGVLFGLKVGLRVASAWIKKRSLKKLILMVVIAITFDTAQIIGFWRGTIERFSIAKFKRKLYP